MTEFGLVHGKQIELDLPCTLTDEELQSRSIMLAETVVQVDDVQEARSSSAKDFREKLVGLLERQRMLSGVLKTRIERRIVRCIVEFHTPAEATKRITRLDTGEVVREEAMTAAECQLNLWSSKVEFEAYMRKQAQEGSSDSREAQ